MEAARGAIPRRARGATIDARLQTASHRGRLPSYPSTGTSAAVPASAQGRAEDLDIEITDLLAQGIAVEPQQGGSPDLIAARGRQGRHQQGSFEMLQHAVVQARRRQVAAVAGEMVGKVALDGF